MNDVSVYLGRQTWGGVTDRKDAFRAHVLCFEPTSRTFETPVFGAETTRSGL